MAEIKFRKGSFIINKNMVPYKKKEFDRVQLYDLG